ncbi:MAG: 50S ribosomal protein L13 [Patescibacteria group bacterium]
MTATPKNIVEIDMAGQSIGRAATRIATLLRGKHLVTYNPSVDPEISVRILNLDKVVFTGNKLEQKQIYRFSGYPGGLNSRTLGSLWEKKPKEVLRRMVRSMLPDNTLRARMILRLVFA